MAMRTEMTRFVTTTSMKGLGRAFTSDYGPLRIMWKISVIVFWGIATYHCTSVVTEFLSHPITTTMSFARETNFSTSRDNIPDVTVCNLNPFSSTNTAKGGYVAQILNVSEYVDMVQHCDDCPSSVAGISIHDLFFTTSAYYQNIGRDNASLLGHDGENFIISCHIELFDGFSVEFVPCTRLLKITKVRYPSLFNCYHLSVLASSYSGFITGYKLVMHLDNYDTTYSKYFTSKYQFTNSLGAVMIPHARGTKGHIQRNAIFLHPGTGADLKIMTQIIRRLGPPYGSCEKIRYLPYNTDYRYTLFTCVSGCVQEAVLKECDCRDVELMDILHHNQSNARFCLSFTDTQNLNITINSYGCAFNQRAAHEDECAERCPFPCEDVQYDWKLSKAKWPKHLFTWKFYKDHIKDRPWESRYADLNRSAYQQRVERNFLSLNVYGGAFEKTYLTDRPKISDMTFVANLGAALGLWASISAAVIIEVIEFFVRGCYSRRHSKNSSES